MKYIQSVAVLLLASTFLMTGCNTTKGFGQDLQEGGQAIQKAANDATSNNSSNNTSTTTK